MEDRITLNDRYEIIDKIGDGGMAEVFHGYDTILHRDVTIKILRDQYSQNKNFVARFKQEAYAAASLNHANIASVYDVGNEHGIQYIVLEYILGRTLKEIIVEHGPLDYKTAVKYAIGVASALAHAHSKNLVHCDVKSQNILVDTKGIPKITDFGIAKAVGQSNIQGEEKEVMGSVYYLAPEQALGQKVTPQADVYSLGVVLFEMLTGNLPFKGDTPEEVARQHLECQTPSVLQYDPDIPQALDNIVAKALAKNPLQRYGSAQELEHDLIDAEDMLYEYEDADTKRVTAPLEDNKHYADAAVGDETQVISKTAIIKSLNNTAPQKTQPPHKSHTKRYVALFLGALLIMLGFIYGAVQYNKDAIIVPDLKGKTVVQAEEILTKLKLTYSLAEEYNAEVKSGQVCRQNPAAKSRVKEGRKILVVISKGAEPGIVPDVTKKNLGEATVMLHNAQLEVGSVTVKYEKSAPQGSVLAQSTPPGTKLNLNSKVDLTVNISDGQTVVPGLAGLSLDEAKSTLASLGLSLGRINKVNSKEKANTILDADLQAGKVVEKGTSINVNVSMGEDKKKPKEDEKNKDANAANQPATQAPATTTTEKTIEFVVPGSKSKHAVKVTLSDANSSRVIYTGSLEGGARVRQTVTAASGSSIQFYVDDRLMEDKKL